ncbi:MAG: Rne/Rng family ribonuclease [Acidobacteriaceae bacterium]|nr:Rne/Rng family ribonuclease [Acidobacteriaceae bacterium]
MTEHVIPEAPAPPLVPTLIEAEAVCDIIAIERESAGFTPEELAESPVPAVELIEVESLETEDEPDAAEGEPTDIESIEIESIVIGEMEAEPSDAEGDEEEPGEAGSSEPAPAEQQRTPHVHMREQQGGRYGQRGSRRMRRRSRGGAPGPTAEAIPTVHRPEQQRYRGERNERQEKPAGPSITDLLKEGQEILVQIAKEPLGQKGARITSHIALPGRYVVFMPTLEHMGVSRKIASDEERLRLKKILQAHRSQVQGGFIVRTAGEGKTEEEILADMNFLMNLWQDIRQKAEKKPAPVLLHHDLDIVQRILRDQVTDHFKSIWVDNEDAYESILRFVQRFQPALVSRVKLYTRSAPIFDAFNITQELEKALRPKVWLKSGGYIVINQTEALVAIDVNTGKYVGKSNRLEDTIVKTNTEAVKEIVRQIRLRDLGGIIVVDFIDMDERKNRQKVMQTLEETMRADKAPNKILQFNDFGLVAITRKRVKQSLERALCSPCPYCEGAGYVKSVQTTVGEIVQEAQKIANAVEGKDVLLRVHPEVAKFLKSSHNKYLEELEEVLRKPVLVKGDPNLHQDKFDLA